MLLFYRGSGEYVPKTDIVPFNMQARNPTLRAIDNRPYRHL